MKAQIRLLMARWPSSQTRVHDSSVGNAQRKSKHRKLYSLSVYFAAFRGCAQIQVSNW